jgi:uncharacterized protein
MPVEIETGLLRVDDNEAAQQFEIHYNDMVAVLAYRRTNSEIAFLHTVVPAPLERHGVAGRLAQHGLEYARETGRSVLPYCPYVSAYIEKHPEYEDLVQWPRGYGSRKENNRGE